MVLEVPEKTRLVYMDFAVVVVMTPKYNTEWRAFSLSSLKTAYNAIFCSIIVSL